MPDFALALQLQRTIPAPRQPKLQDVVERVVVLPTRRHASRQGLASA